MKTAIETTNAPKAIGPYSQGISFGGLIFTSGQLPIDPVSGKLAEGIEAQTVQSMNNVKAILASEGLTMDHILKTTVYLSDMANFAPMNEIYKSYFKGTYPARSAFQVARLPMDALVEIEVVAGR